MKIATLIAGVALSAACFMMPQAVNAVPALPTPVTMTMPDGSVITVRVHGDEKFHYYTSTDNHVLVADEKGFLCYATENGAALKSSGVVAHNPEMRTAQELKYISTLSSDATSRLRSVAAKQSMSARAPKASGQFSDLITAYPTLGSPRALVLLVEFPDQKFITPNALSAFTDLMTREGYDYNGATGSARDYFVENSRGLFTPEFDVFGPYTLPQSMAYYGRESASLHDVNPYEMVSDACSLADGDVDFSQYDEDGDGVVDNVFVFYAGYGQNSGAPAETIWPHAANIWTYGGIKLVLDGVQVGNYACTNEIQGTSGSVRTGIGTFCHEFSHVLGLPDLYATDGSSSFTPNQFELMDIGPYLNHGNTPPYMSVYDRACLKWINPRELNVGETVVLKSFKDVVSESDDEALLITTISENEYYLLENRQQRGWDTYIPAHGMLVWHIDYDPQIWKENRVNSISRSQHLRVDIVEADGIADQSTMNGDPFPGVNGVTSFTDNTAPSMRTWTNVRVEKPITNIHEQDGVVSFDILGGGDRIAAVEANAATEVGPVSFKANWTGRSEIYNYEIDLYKGDEVVPMQTFTKQTNSLADCYIEISGLTPSTSYSYVVRAVSGDRKSPNSQRIRVATTAPTFDMLQVKVLDASDITTDSFVARWEEMADAATYSLNVYTKSFNEPTTDECDFADGLTLPEGWYTNANATSGMAGTFGGTRPSLRMSANNDLLRTPTYEVDVNGITFWTKAAASTAGTFKVLGLVNGSWVEIVTYDASTFVGAARTIEVNESTTPAMPSGCRSVQIQFERTSGSMYLDDVVVAYNGATSRKYVPGYEAKDMGVALSEKVGGLANNTRYFYTVDATSVDGLKSLPSDEKEVLTSYSSIDGVEASAGLAVVVENDHITVATHGTEDCAVAVYTIGGQTVFSANIGAGATVSTASLIHGVYVVKAGDTVTKVEL